MRAYLTTTGVLFALMALAHLGRVIRGTLVQVGDLTIPDWASYVGFVVASALTVWAFRLLRQVARTL